MEGEAEVLEPPDQGNKGPPRTLGERRVQLDLLLCKVEGWQQVGSASPHTWDEGTFPVVPARQGHTHAHRHTQLRHQTQGSEGREGRAGKEGIRGIIGLTVCLPPPDAPRPSSLQHLPPGLRQLQGQRASKGKSGRGKEDRSSLGDSHKGGEDADPQHCSQLAQSIQEAKGRGPAREAPEPSHAAVRAQEEEDRQGKWGKMAGSVRERGGRVAGCGTRGEYRPIRRREREETGA